MGPFVPVVVGSIEIFMYDVYCRRFHRRIRTEKLTNNILFTINLHIKWSYDQNEIKNTWFVFQNARSLNFGVIVHSFHIRDSQ